MSLSDEVREAIDKAYSNIHKFHEAQVKDDILVVETMPGVVCSRFARPIARVGLYIPGGTAVLPSTALMLGIPAQVAGCHEVVFATPPRQDGSLSPEVVYVAHLIGASAILKAGGAQAIAALAYGTETVPKVDKIFGPGNQWVTAAKMLVQNDTDALVSIDMPAGPSEVLVRWKELARHLYELGLIRASRSLPMKPQTQHSLQPISSPKPNTASTPKWFSSRSISLSRPSQKSRKKLMRKHGLFHGRTSCASPSRRASWFKRDRSKRRWISAMITLLNT
jgi:hypothetical protein